MRPKHTNSQSCSCCGQRWWTDNDDKRHVSLASVVYQCRPPRLLLFLTRYTAIQHTRQAPASGLLVCSYEFSVC